MIPRLKEHYDKIIVENLKKKFSISNKLMLPRVSKVILNMGLGSDSIDKKKVQSRFPLLWRIPWIGKRLFTHTSDIESKTDLVIQITPKIIYDSYSGINKSNYHLETENEAIIYGKEASKNLDDKSDKNKDK